METTIDGLKELFRKVIKEEFGPMKPVLCKFGLELVDSIPDYFWAEAASSSGLHHPSFGLGEGGLARHSLMVYRWLKILMEANEQDMSEFMPGMTLAALFHDCCKRGIPGDIDPEHTKFEHPFLSAKFVLDKAEQFAKDNKDFIDKTSEDEDIFKKDIAVAVSAIETHMGKWNTSKNSKIVLPKPKTAIQYMVHLADYIASRKCTTWDVTFDKETEYKDLLDT
jgi:hypothetical protein